ncbi:MAG TPA: DUF4252 domain-containing protein [Candidatus Krumholzibacteria bacterium]|nr:DUF4252 domain-containing protein [Candidatus Krumholzibacteria bacterium]
MNPVSSRSIRGLAAAIGLATLSMPGCFWSPELSSIRQDMEKQMPGSSFNKNIELSLGPLTLSLARLVTSLVPGTDEARPWLHGLSHVQVGVYEASIDSVDNVRTPRRLRSLLDHGWETAVRVRDHNEAVWILYRPDGDHVKEVFVVVLNEDELVLVKASGHLERLVAAALDEAHGHHHFPGETGS